jgi:N-acetyl-gamma-glutamyl-phosphate reductase
MANANHPLSVAILGASGYTGVELVRLLSEHPYVDITALSADRHADKPIAEVFPHLSGLGLPVMQKIEAIDFSKVDVVFCCLPHAASQAVIASLPHNVVVIDLSADFRLRDPQEYAKWYGHAHHAEALQKEAVYGLSELYPQAVQQARLVANPGCYPTCTLLPLLPLLRAGLLDVQAGITVDAKSGTSGAGRALKEATLYCEVNESVSAYGIGNHRHLPEIMQEMEVFAPGSSVRFRFTPHLMPMNRGMLASIYATLAPGKTLADARNALEKAYANTPFVQLSPAGQVPSTAQVRGTNLCRIGLAADRFEGGIVLVSVIDNLVKGASGQAVQNMNLRFGFPETLGLPRVAVVP